MRAGPSSAGRPSVVRCCRHRSSAGSVRGTEKACTLFPSNDPITLTFYSHARLKVPIAGMSGSARSRTQIPGPVLLSAQVMLLLSSLMSTGLFKSARSSQLIISVLVMTKSTSSIRRLICLMPKAKNIRRENYFKTSPVSVRVLSQSSLDGSSARIYVEEVSDRSAEPAS